VSVWTIVVAAGSGERFGAAKQFEPLAGSTVLEWSLVPALAVSDGVIAVLPDGASWDPPPGVTIVGGGATRSDSVRCGLAVVPVRAEIVVVHDAARPLASADLFRSVVAVVRAGADAAIPGVAVADTVKRVRGAEVVETVSRDELIAVQTPQAFRASALRAAHETGAEATDDAALVERIGGRVIVVPGEPANSKITNPAALELMRSGLSGGPQP
jgi:2-C-methyl-D-erythritol 4-phosphate cytidylyltransferase